MAPESCSTAARLTGLRVVDASAARAGVLVFDRLSLQATTGASGPPLCGGDYELLFSLYEWNRFQYEERWANTTDVPAWEAVPPSHELTPSPFGLSTAVAVRLVPSLNWTSSEITAWSVELPAFYNTSDMTRTSSTVSYVQIEALHTVTTTVTTNTTVQTFEWLSPEVPIDDLVNNTNQSALTPGAPAYGLHNEGVVDRTPVWPANGTTPRVTTEQSVHTRCPPTNLLSQITATDAVLLNSHSRCRCD